MFFVGWFGRGCLDDAFDFFGGHAAFDHGAFHVVFVAELMDFDPAGADDSGDGNRKGQ